MKIILKHFKANHYKGLLDVELNFNGKNVEVRANNGNLTKKGVGKTSVISAIYYCLFRKDHENKRKIGFEPTDENGEVLDIYNLDIELVFGVDGVDHTFSRNIIKERTNRADAVKTHKISNRLYYNGELFSKEMDFTSKVNSVLGGIDEFWMFTNVKHIIENLHWADARKMITDSVGVVSTDQVLQKFELNNSEFIQDIQLKAPNNIITEQTAKIKTAEKVIDNAVGAVSAFDELISENDNDGITDAALKGERQRLLVEIESHTTLVKSNEETETRISEYKEVLNEAVREIAKLTGGNKEANETDIRMLELDLKVVQKKLSIITTDYTLATKNPFTIHDSDAHEKEKFENIHNSVMASIKSAIDKNEKLINELTKFDFSKAACTHCNQLLPVDKINLLKTANANKISRLKIDINDEKENSKKAVTIHNELIKAFDKEVADNYSKQKKRHDDKVVDITNEGKIAKAEVVEIEAKLNAKRSEIDNAAGINAEEIQFLESKKMKAEETIDGLNKQLHVLTSIADKHNRIAEINGNLGKADTLVTLKNKKAAKNEEIENAENAKKAAKEVIDLVQYFIATRAKMITDKIQPLFTNVKIILFKELDNGSLSETFTIAYKGDNYSDLNGAGKVIAALELNQVMQGIKNVSYPVFIDEKQSVNQQLETNGQLITFQVSDDDDYKVDIS